MFTARIQGTRQAFFDSPKQTVPIERKADTTKEGIGNKEGAERVWNLLGEFGHQPPI